MITDIRTATYIESVERCNSDQLEELYAKAVADGVPVIKRPAQSFLKTVIAMNNPRRVLEVGTAVGFSALMMAECGPADMKITTIENYEKRIPIARENFEKFGRADQIRLVEGDASVKLSELADAGESYDLIFMDAAKAQYINYFPDIMRLLVSGGVLISDNVLQDGDIVESRFAVKRRDRTIHSRMREYLAVLCHDERLTTTILPIGDGITLSVKNR